MNTGEVNAESAYNPAQLAPESLSSSIDYTHFITNSTINGLIAQQESGLLIIMEHRVSTLFNPRRCIPRTCDS